MKAIIFSRVSSREQEEGFSIDAQITRMREYADKKGLLVEHEFRIVESSTKQVRKEFNKIITLIKRSREPLALLVETVDRLQRGYRECSVLDDLRKEGKLEIHFYRENLIIQKNSNSSELMRWELGVFMARSFVLQHSDNIKRSRSQAIKEGRWANIAPLGYMNVTHQGVKDVVPNPDQKYLLVEMFEMYATGNYSVKQITSFLKDKGLASRQGGAVSKSQIAEVLKNPFYYGVMKTKEGYFPHKHESLISYSLFKQCETVREQYFKKPFKKQAQPFVFRGIITCANCGCRVTPELKKKPNAEYIYYSCTNAKGDCERAYVNEDRLLESVVHYFDKIYLPDTWIEEITQHLKSIHDSKKTYTKQQKEMLRREQDRLEERISKMYDDKLDGIIDEGLFQRKMKEFTERKMQIIEDMKAYTKADENYYITANLVLNLAKRAGEIFRSSEIDEKRELLKLVFQNFELDGKKLLLTLREPFNLIFEGKKQLSRPENCR